MYARKRYQICLELSEVAVETPIEPERGSDAADRLCDQPVQVGELGLVDVQVSLHHVIHGLVVHHEGDLRVLEHLVPAEHGVVGLHDATGQLD